MIDSKQELKLKIKKKGTLPQTLYNPDDYYLLVQGDEDTINSITPKQKKEVVENFFKLKVSIMLKMVGNNYIYQQKILLSICFVTFFLGFINNQFPYLFYVPKYECLDKNGESFPCSLKQACFENEYGYAVKPDRISIVTDFQLYCEKEKQYLTAQTVCFLIAGFLSFVSGILSDYFGRKSLLIICWIVGMIGFCMAYFSSTFYTIVFGVIFIQIFLDAYFSISSIFIGEIMGKKFGGMTISLSFFIYGLGSVAFVILNLYISNWKSDIIVFGFTITLSLIFLLPFKETPFLNYKLRNIGEYYHSLLKISRINQKQNVVNENKELLQDLIGLNEEQLSGKVLIRVKKKPEVKIIQKSKKFSGPFWKNLFCISIFSLQIYLAYGIFTLSPQDLGTKNLSLNIFASNVGEFLGYLAMSRISHIVQRKKFSYAFCIGLVIQAAILTSFTLLNIRDNIIIQYTELIISFLIKFECAMAYSILFVWINEIFSTKVRGLSAGFAIYVGRSFCGFSSYIAYYSRIHNYHPLAFMLIIGFIGLYPTYVLPETYKRELKN